MVTCLWDSSVRFVLEVHLNAMWDSSCEDRVATSGILPLPPNNVSKTLPHTRLTSSLSIFIHFSPRLASVPNMLFVVAVSAVGSAAFLQGLVVIVFRELLKLPRCAGFQENLRARRRSWLAIPMAFSPALTLGLIFLRPQNPVAIAPLPQISILALGVSTYLSTAFAGCWLSLPEGSGKPVRALLAFTISVVLWFCGLGVLAICALFKGP